MTSPASSTTPGLTVSEALEVSTELVEAFAVLIPQLSSSSPPTTRAELQAIVDSDASTLFVATDPAGRVVGSLTLVIFRIPTGIRAWIEDVVVDTSMRGQGVGDALVDAAIARSETAGARTVDLTSRPTREAAHRLYLRKGFTLRTTNVYRFTLEG